MQHSTGCVCVLNAFVQVRSRRRARTPQTFYYFITAQQHATSATSTHTNPDAFRSSISSTRLPKMNMFSSPTSWHISMLAPSRVPMVSAPLICACQGMYPKILLPYHELHVAGARRLCAGGGNLLREVGGRNDCADKKRMSSKGGPTFLGHGDSIVLKEDDLQTSADQWILVDHCKHVKGGSNDEDKDHETLRETYRERHTERHTERERAHK